MDVIGLNSIARFVTFASLQIPDHDWFGGFFGSGGLLRCLNTADARREVSQWLVGLPHKVALPIRKRGSHVVQLIAVSLGKLHSAFASVTCTVGE